MNKKEIILSKASKMLVEVQEMINELNFEKNNETSMIADDELSEDDLEFDMDDVLVQSVDGVLIKENKDEVRLLFYYIKPKFKDLDDETIYYKAVAEFRIPRSTFQRIAKAIQDVSGAFNNNKGKIDDSSCEKNPMFA